ncbi:hypothetical protein [Methylobacterium sp. Leaf89]|uniref:hypothetical protein n=1 Tax=Methylobacterium sp. Leaf89 TaxID=1736245 RepID=UPI000A53444C|nr:hypothetical protein [Methylobacterium sp. Leaf89]
MVKSLKNRAVKVKSDLEKSNKKAINRKKTSQKDKIVEALIDAKLSDASLTEIMLHCASILQYNKIKKISNAESVFSAQNVCYVAKSQDPKSIVRIRRGGFATQERMTREQADAANLLPCGYERRN